MAKETAWLFSTAENVRNVASLMSALADENSDEERRKQLWAILSYISQNPENFDRNCQIGIRRFGVAVQESLLPARDAPLFMANIELLTATIYRLVLEFEISVLEPTPPLVSNFRNFVVDSLDSFNAQFRPLIDYARHEVPIEVLKELLNHEAIGSVKDLGDTKEYLDRVVITWSKQIREQKSEADALQKQLEEYSTGANFVLLHKGFNNLSIAKYKELRWLRWVVGFFGLVVVSMIGFELYWAVFRPDKIKDLAPQVLITTTLLSISLTLVLVYFFRLAVRSADMCKAQILQLELRKTLCEFIQHYAPFAKDLKASNPDSLAKFESVIFAGLVSNDEKLPATFDGMEQVAGLLRVLQPAKP